MWGSLLWPVLAALGARPWGVDGHPPRARAEAVAPLREAPVEQWTFGPFAFEGSPLVLVRPEGERILVHGRDATGRRALVVLDGASGRVLVRTLLAARQALAPSAAGERVAVRTAPDRVDLFRLSGARLFPERSFTHADSVSTPRLDGEELLLREGAELACHDLAADRLAWRARVAGAFRGDPELRGAHVFAGWHAPDGTVHVAWLDRTGGSVRGDLTLGRPRASLTDAPDACTLVVHDDRLFARLVPPLPATSGAELAWAHVPFDGERLGSARLHDFLAPPLATATGWLAPERATDGSTRWILDRREAPEGQDSLELAARTHHAWLADSSVGAARAGEVLYLGGAAADERSLAVLWRRPRASDFAPVAVPRGLLVIEGERLVRLGSKAGPQVAPAARARKVAEAEERRLGERLALLASKALRSGDAARAQALVDEAEGLGASGRSLELVRAEARRAQGRAGSAPVAARRTVLDAEEAAARADATAHLAEAARAAEPPEARALLAELFLRDPDHADGLRVLETLLPPGLDLAQAPPLSWLELARATALRPIARIEPTADERPSPDAARLAEERARWRDDAHSWRSERLLLVTAGAAPHSIAHTLITGEFLCDVLEELFPGARPATTPLELVLYPTRAEYLEHSGTDLGGLERVLGFTAGHFDLGARVSRLFVPEEDADGARLLGVAAHELTHHWLALRAPFAPLRASPATRGFWIVEGLATWVEELALDAEQGTWALDLERAASLDTLRNAGPRDLLDWGELLAASSDDYRKLETRPTCALPLDWQLGTRHPRSPMQLFYAQSAALTHYLFSADGGRHRALLLEAVEGYYRGNPVDVAHALGLRPAELGARVTEWACSAER